MEQSNEFEGLDPYMFTYNYLMALQFYSQAKENAQIDMISHSKSEHEEAYREQNQREDDEDSMSQLQLLNEGCKKLQEGEEAQQLEMNLEQLENEERALQKEVKIIEDRIVEMQRLQMQSDAHYKMREEEESQKLLLRLGACIDKRKQTVIMDGKTLTMAINERTEKVRMFEACRAERVNRLNDELRLLGQVRLLAATKKAERTNAARGVFEREEMM